MDWRGYAQRITSIVESDPSTDYLLIEPSFGSGSRANYYFERYSDDVSVSLAIPSRVESAGEFTALDELLDTEQPERVVVVLNHFTESRFANLIGYLEERFDRVIAQFDDTGRGGYVIFEARATDIG